MASASSSWGARGRTTGPSSRSKSSSSSSSSKGLCIVGSACRFGASREVVAAAESRLIKIQVDGETVTVDRYDVRLLLGDVGSFAQMNCSEERRLAKLQESREIEEMRYEDLPRCAAFSDDLPPPQQQQQREWTPTLEQQQQQQQQEERSSRFASLGTSLRESGSAVEGGEKDFSAVPPPVALDEPDGSLAAAISRAASPSPPREAAASGAAAVTTEKAAGRPTTTTAAADSSSSSSSLGAEKAAVSAAEGEHQQQQQRQQEQEGGDAFVSPFPDLPPGLALPESLREYLIVERTAHFVREEGDRMEFRLLLDQERRLPFLCNTHRLYPFYCWLKHQGHSLLNTTGANLPPPRIRALLAFAYSLKPAADQQQQQQQHTERESQAKATEGRQQQQEQQQQQEEEQKQQQQQQIKQDLDGGLGLLLSYGSDDEDETSPKQEHQQELEHQQQQQEQSQQQQQQVQQQQLKEAQQESSPGVVKKRPPPPPPPQEQPAAAAATGASSAAQSEDNISSEDEEEASRNPKDLTYIWRSQGTRFSLKKPKRDSSTYTSQGGDSCGSDEVAGDAEAQLAALPKPPWALPSAKLGLSKDSCLAIQQIGHHLLHVGEVSLVQHAETYEDDTSPFPFLWTTSMDLRYLRYVLKCVETEIQKATFVRPSPLPGPTHELARSFLARLQLDHHLQQRKQQLMQQCVHISEATPDDPSVDYLKTVEAAAAAAAAAASGKSSSLATEGSSANTSAATTESNASSPNAAAAAAAAETPAVYVGAAESQVPPETAAHLQMLLQQMTSASAENDAATYMACYSAYCYALAALSADPAAAATGAAAATTAAATTAGGGSPGASVPEAASAAD